MKKSTKVVENVFHKVNQQLKNYQACLVERSLSPEGYDTKPAVRIGHALRKTFERLPACWLVFTNGKRERIEQPHLTFSVTDLTAVFIDRSRLNDTQKALQRDNVWSVSEVQGIMPIEDPLEEK